MKVYAINAMNNFSASHRNKLALVPENFNLPPCHYFLVITR